MTPATGVVLGPESERRIWQRLPLAIPVFVRGTDIHNREFLELATVIDISAGGALVTMRPDINRHDIKAGSRLKLEIPCVPVHDLRRKVPRPQILPAKVLRVVSNNNVQIFALKFSRALIQQRER
jgi:hypothetical protein